MTGCLPSATGRKTSARSTRPSSTVTGTSQSMRIPSRTSLLGSAMEPHTMTSVRFRVIEPFRSIFYAPNLVAIHGGHFAAEGLEIALTTASHELNAADALRDGRVDVALSGLMRSFDLIDRGGPRLVHFPAVDDRHRLLLLDPAPPPRLAWSDLARPTVLSLAGAPAPWLCIHAVRRRPAV